MRWPRRDPSLAHQPILGTQNKNTAILLSCNCLVIRKPQGGPVTYPAMATVRDFADTVREYNKPENHRGEFGKEWMLHGVSSQGIQQGTA